MNLIERLKDRKSHGYVAFGLGDEQITLAEIITALESSEKVLDALKTVWNCHLHAYHKAQVPTQTEIKELTELIESVKS